MTEGEPQYSCPFINQYVRIPRRVSARLDADHPAEYEGVRHCVGLIIVNLLAQGEVAYSRNSNFYTEHRTRHYTRTNMLRAVEIAAAQGRAVKSRAGFWNTKYERGLSSTLRPGPRLKEFGPRGELELDTGSLPLLVVDGRQVFDSEGLASVTGRPGPVSPESLAFTPRLASIYGDALRLNRGYWNGMGIDRRGLGPGERCLGNVGLTRVFKGGGVGRWFQRGGLSYQQLPKAERAKLILDGEKVMELDYPAMHPHILYAWEGTQCPEDFYERVADLCGCTRSVAKSMVLLALNATSYASLSSAINLNKAQESKANLARREPEPILYEELKEMGLKPIGVVDAISEAHPAIRKYLFSGSANRLMLEESEIMTEALLKLMGLGIPALPVHDSLIAPRRHRESVRQVMEDAYRRYTGFDIAVA